MMQTQTAQSGIWIEHTNHKVTACKNGYRETVTATWQNVGGGVISDSLVLSFQGGIHINYLYFFLILYSFSAKQTTNSKF